MPEIHFLPCQRPDDTPPHRPKPGEQLRAASEGELFSYECPLYCTSKRTGNLFSTGLSSNFITAMSLPTSLPPVHWVFRGTAMLCQQDE
ncbi:dynein axonemal heavy chain 12-like [Clupea harengus]|uniref:Dynein axonemal heavy chain 12-like n=1 Tax=Clupea harengus TaxID=7950 RepID=A0A8M1KSJ1_CLUHA|nr:dynein axonemal heavy chain 12-like [Clupea harengus]